MSSMNTASRSCHRTTKPIPHKPSSYPWRNSIRRRLSRASDFILPSLKWPAGRHRAEESGDKRAGPSRISARILARINPLQLRPGRAVAEQVNPPQTVTHAKATVAEQRVGRQLVRVRMCKLCRRSSAVRCHRCQRAWWGIGSKYPERPRVISISCPC